MEPITVKKIILSHLLAITLGIHIGYVVYPKIQYPTTKIGVVTADDVMDKIKNMKGGTIITSPPPKMWFGIGSDTGSMLPTLKAGDVILIEYVPQEEITIGDILFFKTPGGASQEVVGHRITYIGNDYDGWYAKTKGDANGGMDFWKVSWGNVLGIYKGTIN